MKVVLLVHVKGLGQKGEIKEVSEGYFRNNLAPRRLAAPATGGTVAHVQAQKAKAVEKLENIKESALSLKARLHEQSITLKEKVSESGKLYAGIHEAEVLKAVKEQLKVDLPKDAIKMEHPIKELGEHKIQIRLYKDISATLILHVLTA